jgi:NADP-dependent 3-hydroxy acid dehydrogenase YdfG
VRFILAEKQIGLTCLQDKLSSIAKRLNDKQGTGKYIYRAADVGDYESVDGAIQSVSQELGTIDILINNVRKAMRNVTTLY